MRNRIVVFTSLLAIVIVSVIFMDIKKSSSQNEGTPNSMNTTPQQQTQKSKSGGKGALVVYFSRREAASSVYKDQPLEIGNTKKMALFIREKTQGEEFELLPVKDYPNNFKKTSDVAQEEQNNNERPKFKGSLPDVSQYDTIFIGAPVWWGDYPMIVHTFLDSVNLDGKNVVPFSTHEGSGLANYPEVLKRKYPKANVLKGLAIRGSDVAYSRVNVKEEVDEWLDGLGY